MTKIPLRDGIQQGWGKDKKRKTSFLLQKVEKAGGPDTIAGEEETQDQQN